MVSLKSRYIISSHDTIRNNECLKQGKRFTRKADQVKVTTEYRRQDKLAQMKYVIASKDRYIKQLEMENKLMRDFLSLTERK